MQVFLHEKMLRV